VQLPLFSWHLCRGTFLQVLTGSLLHTRLETGLQLLLAGILLIPTLLDCPTLLKTCLSTRANSSETSGRFSSTPSNISVISSSVCLLPRILPRKYE